jgi:hypothetical protein
MRLKNFYISALFLSIILFMIWGCTDKYQPAPTMFAAKESSCTHCHLNKALLEEVAEPLPEPSEPAGEG